MPASVIKVITLLFALFVLAIILLADTGQLPGFLRFIHAIPFGDKVGHCLLMGGLCFLSSWTAMQSFPRRQPVQVVALVCLGLALVCSLEEASQSLIGGRSASLFDLLADYAGIAAFGLLSLRLKPRRPLG